MQMKRAFFDWNVDHILVAIGVQLAVALLFRPFATTLVSLAAGGLVAAHGFYCRELAQFEYKLEREEGYDPHAFLRAIFWRARNPLIWPQRWDFFAPTIAVLAVFLLAWWLA